MVSSTRDPLSHLLPLAVAWAAEQESLILAEGIPLGDAQLGDARTLGVAEPDRVRLLHVPAIPAPDDSVLAAAAEAAGLVFPTASGLTLGYGIYLRADRADDRRLLAHELVHTCQCERMGGIEPFLRQYLLECLTVGYAESPMEREAIRVAAGFVD